MSQNAMAVEVSYGTESEYGKVPLLPTPQAVRLISESLGVDTETQKSNEMRADGQVADIKRVAQSASGDFEIELSYGSHDDLWRALIRSAAWSTAETVSGTTFSVTAGSGQYTISDSANGFGAFAANMWVKISGFAEAANNGYAKIVSAAAGQIVVKYNGDGVNETAGENVTIKLGGQCVNGTSDESFYIQKEFTELSNEFELLVGMTINGGSLNIEAGNIVTGNFSWMGKGGTREIATVGAVTAAPDSEVLAAVDEVFAILENGAEYEATSFTFSVANNRRLRQRIKNLGPQSIGMGQFEVTGTLVAYFESKTIMDEYLSYSEVPLAVIFEDGNGNAYIVDIPSVKFNAGRTVAGGNGNDVMADMSWEAKKNASEDITIRFVRIAA